MQDYRLDAIKRPERHATAVDRLMGRRRSAPVDYSGGELPGRKVDGPALVFCMLSNPESPLRKPTCADGAFVGRACSRQAWPPLLGRLSSPQVSG